MSDTVCGGRCCNSQKKQALMVQAAIQSTSVAFKMGVTLIGMFFPFDYSLPLKAREAKCLLQAKNFFFGII